MLALVPIAAIAFLILAIYCAFTESKRIGLYKTFHIFGRFYSYVTIGFFLAGIVCCILPFLQKSTGADVGTGYVLLYILMGIVLFTLGVLMCRNIHRKCGAIMPVLQKHCVRDLIFCGFGMGIKLGFFFIASVWAVDAPQEFIDSNGRKVYKLSPTDTRVFDEHGVQIGDGPDPDSFTPNSNY